MTPVRTVYIGSAAVYRRFAPAIRMFTDNAHASLEGIVFTDGSSPSREESALVSTDTADMLAKLAPEALLCAGDAPQAVHAAIARAMHVFILTPSDFDAENYRAILEAYRAADYIRKRKLVAVYSPMLADSKITLLKKVMQSGRLGSVTAISAKAGAASLAELSIAMCESIAPVVSFLSNTDNKLEYRFSSMKRGGAGTIPPVSLSISGGGIPVAIDIDASALELSVTATSAESSAVWRESDLTITHRNGFKEHYTYSESDTERSLKSFSAFFDFISRRAPYVHCPVEDLIAPMQIRAGLHAITNGATQAAL